MDLGRWGWGPRWLALLAAGSTCGLAGCCRGPSDGTKTWPGPFVQAAAEREATCAVQAGEIRCWGTGRVATRASPPAGPFREVAIGSSCGVGLRVGGALASWGERCEPAPPGDFTALSFGGEACALRSDGDVVCWRAGAAVYQPPDGGTPVPLPPSRPRVVKGPFSRVAAGQSHTCALQTGGELRCWGNCGYRNGRTVDCPARVPPPAGPWGDVASGDDYSCAIRTTGEIACWGDLDMLPSPPPVTAGYRKLSARDQTACALTVAGQIDCWGRAVQWNGRAYAPPPGPFVDLAVGGAHVCGLRPDGSLSCWGVDQQGQVTGEAPWPRT